MELRDKLLEYFSVCDLSWEKKTPNDIADSTETWMKILGDYSIPQIEKGLIAAIGEKQGKFPTPFEVLKILKGGRDDNARLDRAFYMQLKRRQEKAEKLFDTASYYTYSLTNEEKKYVEEYERRELSKVIYED